MRSGQESFVLRMNKHTPTQKKEQVNPRGDDKWQACPSLWDATFSQPQWPQEICWLGGNVHPTPMATCKHSPGNCWCLWKNKRQELIPSIQIGKKKKKSKQCWVIWTNSLPAKNAYKFRNKMVSQAVYLLDLRGDEMRAGSVECQ